MLPRIPLPAARLAPAFPVLLLAVGLSACGAAQTSTKERAAGDETPSAALCAAIDAEAADPTAAEGYLRSVESAAADPGRAGALAAALGAIDALVFRNAPGMDDVANQPVAFRSREAMGEVVTRLGKAWDAAGDAGDDEAVAGGRVFVRAAIARALHELALYSGDPTAAAAWAARRGCVQEAAVLGPIDSNPVTGIERPSPIAASGAFAQSYPGVAPFAARVTPVPVHADACQIDANATSALQGVRAVVVDVEVPEPQRIGVALTSTSAAVVDVGGALAIRRGFEAGGRPVTRFATVKVGAGTVRIVARVGQKNDGGPIELAVLGEDGTPLATRAPRPGDLPSSIGAGASAIEIAPAGTGDEAVAVASAGLLALGEARRAEHLLEAGRAATKDRPPRLELLFARAVDAADDLPDVKAVDRLRAATDRILETWPASWEARVLHARLTEQRRGAGDGTGEALKELGARPALPLGPAAAGEAKAPDAPAAGPPAGRMTAAYIATAAARAGLVDVAEGAYRALEAEAPGSPLLAGVDARLHRRAGAEAVRAACAGGLSRADSSCFDAHVATGNLQAALGELERLRKLRTSPDAMREAELYQRVLHGDAAGALAVYDKMAPAQRALMAAPALAARAGKPAEARARLERDMVTARDAPFGIAPVGRALGLLVDPSPAFEAEGKQIVAQDRASAFLPGAGTAVLRHVERYDIDARGLVHYVYYDLRRVSGTTDVEVGATLYGPRVEGRGVPRMLRRRIHKKDGRTLEPDAAANAAQGHSDLSQLEVGDYVEQIVEGWALPGDSGQLVLDTPDLLPERTSVREAEIQVRRAASIPFATWAHPLLGKAEERTEGDVRVSVWRLKNQAPRRMEDGVPRMEQSVAVSLGTQTWAAVARAIRENIRSLEDKDPYVARWAKEAAGDAAPGRAQVERVVAAAGKTVKVAQGGDLSDTAASYGGGSQYTTARTILELGQGSRSWVVYRALAELGVKAEIAVAETEPFSASADFPPHVGRFRHPLVVARLADGDLWIDADVEGPPLPPGRISPELRGRAAMLADGRIITVEGASAESGDEIDVRLTLDEKGDARGTLAALLHGRPAQALSEAFETVVGTDRQDALRRVVLGWLPWADVEDVSLSSSEGSWEVAIRATITIHGYGRPEGKDGKNWVLPGLEPVHYVFPRQYAATLGATYASRGARQSALNIGSALQYHVHRRVELPAGATVTRPPLAVGIKDARLQAERRGKYEGQVVEDDFTLSLPTGTVQAEGYKAFVESVLAVDGAFMSGTRVKVK